MLQQEKRNTLSVLSDIEVRLIMSSATNVGIMYGRWPLRPIWNCVLYSEIYGNEMYGKKRHLPVKSQILT